MNTCQIRKERQLSCTVLLTHFWIVPASAGATWLLGQLFTLTVQKTPNPTIQKHSNSPEFHSYSQGCKWQQQELWTQEDSPIPVRVLLRVHSTGWEDMSVGVSPCLNRSLNSAGVYSNYQKLLLILFSNGRGFIWHCVWAHVSYTCYFQTHIINFQPNLQHPLLSSWTKILLCFTMLIQSF